MFNFANSEIGLTADGRRWRLETRSSVLWPIVRLILLVNLVTGGRRHASFPGHYSGAYAVVTALRWSWPAEENGTPWTVSGFVVVDAPLVVALFHEHLFGPLGNLNHSLTGPSLAVAFLLSALRLQPRLLVLFTWFDRVRPPSCRAEHVRRSAVEGSRYGRLFLFIRQARVEARAHGNRAWPPIGIVLNTGV